MLNLSKRNRKTNLLIAVAGLHIGGAEVVIQRLVQTIDRNMFNVSVCCIKRRGMIGHDLAREGFDIVTLSNSSIQKVDYFTFFKLLRIIHHKRIDIVHSHTRDALADAAVCRLLMPRFKLVHTFHFGNYPHIAKRQLWMEGVFSRLANRLIAVGEAQMRQIQSTYRFRNNDIEKVWNGVQTTPCNAEGDFRSRVGAGNKILIGTIATLIDQKGLFDLLAVARHFRTSGDTVRFVIVGEGHLRSKLEAMRKEYGLEDTVVLTGWVKDAGKLALPSFDVFFQPSLWEAMSIVLLEAMTASKPIVATRVGETPYIIEDEVDGLLVEPKDVEGMVYALRRLIADNELRHRLGKMAAQKAAKQFTIQHMTRAYERIYLEAL